MKRIINFIFMETTVSVLVDSEVCNKTNLTQKTTILTALILIFQLTCISRCSKNEFVNK